MWTTIRTVHSRAADGVRAAAGRHRRAVPIHRDLPRIMTPSICAELGVTRAQLRTAVRRGYWRPLAPGVVLTRPDPAGRRDWADAGLAIGGPTAALSGWDALHLLGIDGPRPPRPTVLVLTGQGRSRRAGDVLVRRTDRPYSTRRTAGTRAVTPARAVADSALWTPTLGDVRALVAGAVQRGVARVADIERELEAGPQQGSRFLRMALAEVAEGARSAAEAEAAAQLVRAKLPAFELNVPIVDTDGTVLFVLDVLWRELRAALEIDSREHHFGVREWEATMARHNALTRLGCAVTHYPPAVLARPGRPWLREVEVWLRRRAADLDRTYVPGGRVLPVGAPLVVRRQR